MRLLLLLLFSGLILNTQAQSWKVYPYQPEGSLVSFPGDEGFHPEEPVEWWYINGTLTGETTGKDYSFMISYFHVPMFGFDGFRIFNLADENTGEFFPETLPCLYPTIAEDHLNIQAAVYGGNSESWTTLLDGEGDLVPFEYVLSALSASGSLQLNLASQKSPLLIADTGYCHQGGNSYSYYYSLTQILAEGTLTLNGTTETVTGTCWIDHQYGNFNPSTAEQYEWFSLQLSNGMDLNIYNLFTADNTIPENSDYRHFSTWVNDSTSFSASDFTLDRTHYVFMEDSLKCYGKQFHFVYDSIDLIFTTIHNNQEVFLPFRFYEGVMTVEGMVGNTPVSGSGFAELLHSYEHPQIQLTSPIPGVTRSDQTAITWQLLNPDEGRPVKYDIWISVNDSLNYNTVAQGIMDTTWVWNHTGIEAGSPFYIKINGYSVDTTLTGFAYSGQPVFVHNELLPAPDQQNNITLYPIPANNLLNVRLDQTVRNVRVKVYNTAGKPVLTVQSFSGDHLQLPIRTLDPGTYILVIENGRQILTERFTIAR